MYCALSYKIDCAYTPANGAMALLNKISVFRILSLHLFPHSLSHSLSLPRVLSLPLPHLPESSCQPVPVTTFTLFIPAPQMKALNLLAFKPSFCLPHLCQEDHVRASEGKERERERITFAWSFGQSRETTCSRQ